MPTGVEVRIRSARRRANLSQAELAERMGLHRSAVSQWELVDGTMPSLDNLARLAITLNVSFEWLATGRGEPSLAAPTHDPSPFSIEAMAQDSEEERALRALRRIPRRKRSHVIDLLDALA